MAETTSVAAGLFIVGVGRSGGLRVVAAPRWTIDDGTFRLLRDASADGLNVSSAPVSVGQSSPSSIGEHFAVAGPEFGLREAEALVDDFGRRFDAVRGLVLDSGPCVVLDDVSQMLRDVPGIYCDFLAAEDDAPFATETVEVLVRPIERGEESDGPLPPHPPGRRIWALTVGAILVVVALLTLLGRIP